MIRADVHKACIVTHIVDPVREGPRYGWIRKVVPVDVHRMLGGSPLFPFVFVVSNQFLLFGIHGDDRQTSLQCRLDLLVDMPELSVPILMVFPLLGLAVALQTEVLFAQQLGNFDMTDRMSLSAQFHRQTAGAFAEPAQGRFRIADCIRFDQSVERPRNAGIPFGDTLPSGTRLAQFALGWLDAVLDLVNAFGDGLPG